MLLLLAIGIFFLPLAAHVVWCLVLRDTQSRARAGLAAAAVTLTTIALIGIYEVRLGRLEAFLGSKHGHLLVMPVLMSMYVPQIVAVLSGPIGVLLLRRWIRDLESFDLIWSMVCGAVLLWAAVATHVFIWFFVNFRG